MENIYIRATEYTEKRIYLFVQAKSCIDVGGENIVGTVVQYKENNI